MDWSPYALAVTTTVTQYLLQRADGLASEMGKQLWNWIKSRFEGKKEIEQLEGIQDDEDFREFQEILVERAQSDPDGFGAELKEKAESLQTIEAELGQDIHGILNGSVTVEQLIVNIFRDFSGGVTQVY